MSRKDSQPLPTQDAAASRGARRQEPTEDRKTPQNTPRKGHGRNGADAYTGAEKIEVPHESLQPGDPCPKCEEGTVYETNRPGCWCGWWAGAAGGQGLLSPKAALQSLRRGLHRRAARGRGKEKYDATAGSMIALLKYGTGMPFHREEKLQGNLGIPLPASTQWDIVAGPGRACRAGL